MRQNGYGLAPFSNFRPGPTPREAGAAHVREQIEKGEVIVLYIPWNEAKALGILTTLHRKGEPKELRLRPAVAAQLISEQHEGEDTLGPAFERLRDSKRVPSNFYQPRCQNAATAKREAWVTTFPLSANQAHGRDAAAKPREAETLNLQALAERFPTRHRR